MYEQSFQFNSRPFTSTPFVKHYFPAQAIQKSLGNSRLCIDRGSGPVLVIGDAGTGKSLLLEMLAEQYRPQFSVVNLNCNRLAERQELLQSILFELNLPYRGMSEGELRLSLMDYLKPSQACPNGVLLLIDEAQNLPVDLLDEIRLITNYVRDGQPRVRLVMAGSQRLEEALTDSKLESFNQRIAARCYLNSLTQSETAEYVTTHVDRAGGDGKQMFKERALRVIHELSDGCPRFINQICDHALILTATRGNDSIDEGIVREAWSDVQSLPGSSNFAYQGQGKTSSEKTNQKSRPSAISTSTSDDEGWTVIEFGSLDDERDQTTNETLADLSETSESSPFDRNSGVESEGLQPSSFDDSGDSRSTTNGTTSSNKSVFTTEQTPTKQSQSLQSGLDPFAEEFAFEEEIIDRYASLVAAHNQSSLRITRDELSYLKPLDSSGGTASEAPGNKPAEPEQHATGAVSEWSHRQPSSDFSNSNATSEVSRETGIDTDDEDSYSDSPTLKIEDAPRKQSAVSFASADGKSCEEGAQPDATSQQDLRKVIEEKNRLTAQEFSQTNELTDRLSSEKTHAMTDAIDDEPTTSSTQFISPDPQSKDFDDDQYSDDQDILVINKFEEPTNHPRQRPQPIPLPATPVSTGRATRMDYDQLFNQLRNVEN